jgi:hypothetical protein
MGATLHWREPPDRDARDFETFVEFGRGRRSGTGYMAYSERSGPGVLVLHPPPSWSDPVVGFAQAVHAEGFTVLVPGMEAGDAGPERLEAAVEFLVDNWHPRLGIVGFDSAAVIAEKLAAARGCDALVLYRRDEAGTSSLRIPILRHPAATATAASLEETLEFLRHHLS